jgi:hypothetical protein
LIELVVLQKSVGNEGKEEWVSKYVDHGYRNQHEKASLGSWFWGKGETGFEGERVDWSQAIKSEER